MAKKALGRGLGALIGKKPAEKVGSPEPDAEAGERVAEIPVSQIEASPFQPRKEFREEQLEELAESIREKGLLQPLIVRKVESKFELIAGERRWRASQRVGLKVVPAIVRKATDQDVLEWAMIENLQRADLNPIEEAEGYSKLAADFGLTQEQIARRVGKNRASVANALRILNLPAAVKSHVSKGLLSAGHAKAVLSLSCAEEHKAAAEEIIRRGLSVREAEKLVSSMHKTRPAKSSGKSGKSKAAVGADWRDLELRLQQALGTRVRIVGNASKGQLEIQYLTDGDLERILDQLGISLDS